MTKLQKKCWYGDTPTKCDICQAPITNRFIDGRTQHGPWAIMCSRCHYQNGSGLGLGHGQAYELQGTLFVKVAG